MHAREQIRRGAAGLLTSLTTSGSNAFRDAVTPLAESEYPSVDVTTGADVIVEGEESETFGSCPRQVREVELLIIARAKKVKPSAVTDQTAKDLVDQVLAEAQAALYGDTTLGGLTLVDFDGPNEHDPDSNDESERDLAIGVDSYAVRYAVADDDPETLVAWT